MFTFNVVTAKGWFCVCVKCNIQRLDCTILEYFDFDYNWSKMIEILFELDTLVVYHVFVRYK